MRSNKFYIFAINKNINISNHNDLVPSITKFCTELPIDLGALIKIFKSLICSTEYITKNGAR